MEINLTNPTLSVPNCKTVTWFYDLDQCSMWSGDLNHMTLSWVELLIYIFWKRLIYSANQLDWFIENKNSFPMLPIHAESNRRKYNCGLPQSNWTIQSNCCILSNPIGLYFDQSEFEFKIRNSGFWMADWNRLKRLWQNINSWLLLVERFAKWRIMGFA